MWRDFIAPVAPSLVARYSEANPGSLGQKVVWNTAECFPDLSQTDIVLLGLRESRGALNNKACERGVDHIRSSFYQLYPGQWSHVNIVDLGDLISGENLTDTYAGLTEVLHQLIKYNVFIVLMGGSQDLTFPCYKAFKQHRPYVNLVGVDAKFDLLADEQIHSRSYLNPIILDPNKQLFNYTNIAYQTYYVAQEQIDLMDQLYFECLRLGKVRHNISEVEPILRAADLLSIDIGALIHHEAPACHEVHPNGLSAADLCAITRYAGISDQMRIIGLFEFNPELDEREKTAMVYAQALWYAIEGFSCRVQDYPYLQKSEYIRYMIPIEDEVINFYQSPKSQRWWMEIPELKTVNAKAMEELLLVPCTYQDYLAACSQEIPDRWWNTYRKLL